MQVFICILVFGVALQINGIVAAPDDSELEDFDFESETTVQGDYASVETSDANRLDSVFDEMEDVGPDSFSEKEKRIKYALLRSTSDKRNRRIFTQILPILRSLSKPQRTALAALISAQLSLEPDSELSFGQVNI